MIIVSAGRRIDAGDAEEERFPLRNADRVAREVRARLASAGAEALVCSAACGADLIALDAARRLGLRARVVLPFATERFRRTSVVDRPGSAEWDWGALFDELVSRAGDAGDLVILGAVGDESAAYVETNRRLVGEALSLSRAARRTGGERVGALVVWEGGPRGEGDLTADFAEQARRAGIPVEEVLTV